MDGRSKKFVTLLFGLTWFAMLWLCAGVWSTNTKLDAAVKAVEEIEGPRTCTTEDTVYVAKRQIISENREDLRETEIKLSSKVEGLNKRIEKIKDRVEEGIQATYYVQGQLKALFNEMMSRPRPESKNRTIPMRMVTGKERAFYEDLLKDAEKVEKDLGK